MNNDESIIWDLHSRLYLLEHIISKSDDWRPPKARQLDSIAQLHARLDRLEAYIIALQQPA